MRLHPFCLLLLGAVVSAETSTTQSSFIAGCKCEEVSQLQKKSFKVLDCSDPLVLTKNSLVNVSKDITVIYFKNVIIQHIDKDAFEGFDHLEVAIVQESSIGSIDSTAFELPLLSRINFSNTTFEEIPSLNAQYVEELIFDGCKLSKVPNLDNLPALVFLNLANNQIKDIDELAFSSAKYLEELRLSNNSISKLHPNLFNNNPEFTNLNLDNNPLESFSLGNNSYLEYLSLRNCKLTSFDRRTTENLKSLTSLDLTGNQLSVLPIDTFEPLKDLNFLHLSNNKLVELDDNIFWENSKLDCIYLDNNPFQSLPNFRTKQKFFQTYTFSCKNCNLKSIKNSFKNMKGLVTLDLSNNKIQDIEGVFTEMRGLKELFLSNNQITTVGINSFPQESLLATFDLSNNPLLPLDPVVFASLPSLKKLNISSCNLDQLWTNHNAVLPSLEQLFVKNNKLSVIKVDDVSIIPKLKALDLQDNPLGCSDELQDLVDYLMARSIYPLMIKSREEIKSSTDGINPLKLGWMEVLPSDCMFDFDQDDYNEFADEDDVDEDEDDDDNYDYEEDKDDEMPIEATVLENGGFNLAKMSYVLSITSVFFLTALLVLVIAVVTTLLILKRNRNFNMHNGNLPRLKIPLWHTTPGQKKHSGSVYRPLSEELSGSRTPIINRYDFKQTPQVHNSIP